MTARIFCGGLALLVAAACAPPDAGTSAAPMSLSFPTSSDAPGLADLADKVKHSYVAVTLIAPEAAAGASMRQPYRSPVIQSASGWLADADGHVVTAAHIARDVRYRALVRGFDGVERPARILAVVPGREMALLRIQGIDGLNPALRAEDGAIGAGDRVFAIGAPAGRRGSVAVGRVIDPEDSAGVRYDAYSAPRVIRMAIDVSPGHSGGPVFDENGHLVGMVVSFLMAPNGAGTGVGFAIPVADITDWLATELKD